MTAGPVTPLRRPRTRPARIPPLQNGDRLTRPEFERRFDATPGLERAELIEGVVYMPPPISDTESATKKQPLKTASESSQYAPPPVTAAFWRNVEFTIVGDD